MYDPHREEYAGYNPRGWHPSRVALRHGRLLWGTPRSLPLTRVGHLARGWEILMSYKPPRINWNKILNPSGLKEVHHSSKCKKGEYITGCNWQNGKPIRRQNNFMPCTCNVAKKMAKSLDPVALTQQGPWKDATLTVEGEYNVLRLGNAVMRLRVR